MVEHLTQDTHEGLLGGWCAECITGKHEFCECGLLAFGYMVREPLVRDGVRLAPPH